MPRYHQLGNIPPKRHTVFKKKTGGFTMNNFLELLDLKECLLLYHLYPNSIKAIKNKKDISPKITVDHNMQMRAFKGFKITSNTDFLQSRIPVLTNSDVTLHLANPNKNN